VLQCVAVCCSVLLEFLPTGMCACVSERCRALQSVAGPEDFRRRVGVHVLLCAVVCYSVLQGVAVCCTVLQHVVVEMALKTLAGGCVL